MSSESTPPQRARQDPERTVSPEQNDGQPDREEIFEILSNERRRYVLAYLQHHDDGAVDLRTLVTQVAALENDTIPEQLNSDDRKSVYVGLRQTHLPKMDTYNLVEYDKDRGTVAITDETEKARMYLEYVPENDIPWAYHYIGVCVFMGLILALAWAGVFPFAGLGGITIAFITITVVGVSAATHALYTYRNDLSRVYDFEEED